MAIFSTNIELFLLPHNNNGNNTEKKSEIQYESNNIYYRLQN